MIMVAERWPTLANLFGTYLHEWHEMAEFFRVEDSWQAVLRAAATQTSDEELHRALVEMDQLTALQLGDDALGQLLLRLGVNLAFESLGMTSRGWLAEARALVESAII